MKKILKFLFILLISMTLLPSISKAQKIPIYADTTIFDSRVGGSNEVIIHNHTRDSIGFLYNKGGGLTEFKVVNFLNSDGSKDTVWVKKQLKIPVKDTSAYSSHQQGRITFAPSDLSYYGDNGVAWISLSGGSLGVTSIATNNGSGITGGTITGSGTLAIDTSIIATKAYAASLSGGGGGSFGKTDILGAENRAFDANNYNFSLTGADTLLLSGDNVLLGEGVTKMSLQSLGTTELLSTDSLNLNGVKTNITATNIVTIGTNINSNGTDVTNYGTNTNKWGKSSTLGWQTDLTALYAKGLTYSSNTTRKFLSIDSITGKLNYTTFPTTYFDGLLGGTAGQILVKNSTTDGDYSFQTFAGSPFARGAVPTVGTQGTKNFIYPVVATDSMYFGTYAGGTPSANYTFNGSLRGLGNANINGVLTVAGLFQAASTSAFYGTVSLSGTNLTANSGGSVPTIYGLFSGTGSTTNSGVNGINSITTATLSAYNGKSLLGVYGQATSSDNIGTGSTTAFISGVFGYAYNVLASGTASTMYGVSGASYNGHSSNMTSYSLYAKGSTAGSNYTEIGGLLIDSINNTVVASGLPFGIKQKGNNMANFLAGNTMIGYTGAGAVLPVASAALQVNSTTQGFLPPSMTTTQRNAISSPAEGLQVYDLTLHRKTWYNGSSWQVENITITGIVAPTSTPAVIGDKFIDTVLQKIYFATGTSSSADWTIVN